MHSHHTTGAAVKATVPAFRAGVHGVPSQTLSLKLVCAGDAGLQFEYMYCHGDFSLVGWPNPFEVPSARAVFLAQPCSCLLVDQLFGIRRY
jgi:hypothetical protein